MQREEKQIENSIEAIIVKLSELKNQLHALSFKLEHEKDIVNWPTLLDNFALISGQFTTLSKVINNEKTAPLRNLTVLPLFLSPEKDEELYRMTEGRISVFSHDVVPDYLRTKPEPEIEKKISGLLHKANSLSVETGQKQTAAFNKAVGHVLDIIGKAREDWESEVNARSGIGQTSILNDTHTLVSVISMGKGLKPTIPQGVTPGPPGMIVPSGVRPNTSSTVSGTNHGAQNSPMNSNQPPITVMGKAPTIKTNIKSAAQIHPYR